jgi:hypothetical protein
MTVSDFDNQDFPENTYVKCRGDERLVISVDYNRAVLYLDGIRLPVTCEECEIVKREKDGKAMD